MKYFFIGIKGSGMSALALILKQKGHEVEGSDTKIKYFTEEKLLENNIEIYDFGEKKNWDDIDKIIIGNAFNHENIDYITSQKYDIEIMNYPKALNEISSEYYSIAISGTNGKTTTTGLLAQALENQRPSYLIGDGTGYGNKEATIFIYEACEYRETFLNYHPIIGLINNIEYDHPDFFLNIDHVIQTFQKFANQVENLVINGDDKNCQQVVHPNKITFGLKENNNMQATNIKYKQSGINFNLLFNGKELGEFLLPFYGEHMLYNALATITVAYIQKQNIEQIIENISRFKGVKRRFNEEKISENDNVILIDDYAHHATAIDLTIQAIYQKYPDYKLTVLFQPHTFSRAKTFKKEFAKSLVKADEIILIDIFGSAREKNNDVSINIIKDEIIKINSKEKLKEFKDIKIHEPKQVICLLGAGDIDLLYKEKIKKIFK